MPWRTWCSRTPTSGTAKYAGEGAYGIKRQGVYDCYTMLIEDQKGFLADVRFPELPPGY